MSETMKTEVVLMLSVSDADALTQMARDSGMTQAQVVSRLIGMRASVLGLDRWFIDDSGGFRDAEGEWVCHSDLTAAVGLPGGA